VYVVITPKFRSQVVLSSPGLMSSKHDSEPPLTINNNTSAQEILEQAMREFEAENN